MLSIFKKEAPAVAEPISNISELIREGNDFFSDELILLDEKLTGNLFCAEKVVIEQHGMLSGNITSKTCVVNGIVNGDITSLDLLDIKDTAVVMGNIQSATVNIEPGAVINGYITVGEDIEALTRQWNKTKFSTDDYLAAKLAGELVVLTKTDSSVNIVVEQAKTPEPVAFKEEKQPEPVVNEKQQTSPLVAAATPAGKAKEPVNNERWW